MVSEDCGRMKGREAAGTTVSYGKNVRIPAWRSGATYLVLENRVYNNGPMTFRMSGSIVSTLLVLGALTGSSTAATPPAKSPESQAVAAFEARVKEYVALHEKLESTLPKYAAKGTPEQVEKNQRALAALIKSARSNAKPGDFFSPAMQSFVKRVVGEVLSGPDGKTIKASIMDENPGVPQVVLNERYPSSVPLSTMPPEVLAPLPKLKGEMEYRFLGPRLILLDTEADIILDFTGEIVPR
jgi:hypothetical protein